MSWAGRLAQCEKVDGIWKAWQGESFAGGKGLTGLIMDAGTQRTGQAATEDPKSYRKEEPIETSFCLDFNLLP